MSTGQRRLAAIVFTDMVGYSALAQRNESLALQLLERHNAVVRAALKRNGGREVKTTGDGFLLEFDSALDATTCAIDIQTTLAKENKSSGRGDRILVRIGIHVGDVVHRDGDVLGDAVNIASRIMTFATHGGICVSGQVYSQVRNKVEEPLVKLPEQPMKNIDQPIDLYEVVLSIDQQNEPNEQENWNRIAVLPFENISPEARDSYFADGLTEEITSVLSEVRGLRVVARTSINRYRGTTKTVAQVGNELQVAFILEGSVRKAGNKIRVNAQLVDTGSQEQLWSSRYDRDLDDVFTIQSDIATRVTDSLKLTLLAEERRRMKRKDTKSLSAYVAYLKGQTLLHDRTEKAIKGAKQQFESAIREDPEYAKAYSGLADAYILLGDQMFDPVPASLENAKANIDKALELDPSLAEARASLANYYMWDYRFEEAEEEFKEAISLNPSYATAHHWYGNCLEQLGRKEEALAEVLLAEELDPLSSAATLGVVYRYVWSGMYPEARERIRKLKELDPKSPTVIEAEMVYHFGRREWEQTLAYLKHMRAKDPTDPYIDMDIAYIDAVTGKRDEALKLVKKLERVPENTRTKGFMIGFVYAGLNDLDECFKWLNYAVESREFFIGYFRVNPAFENVTNDPRFTELLRKANLPA